MSGYSASVFIPHSDLSWANPELADKEKRFDFLEMRVKANSDTTIYVDFYIDGNYYNTFTFNVTVEGSPLDDAAYGLTPNTTKTDFTLASTDYAKKKIKVGGFGQTIGMKIYNNSDGDDFSISSLRLYCSPLGEGGEK